MSQNEMQFSEVLQDMRAERWEAAMDHLEAVLKSEPSNSEGKQLLWACCVNWAYAEQDTSRQMTIIQRGIAADPHNPTLQKALTGIERGQTPTEILLDASIEALGFFPPDEQDRILLARLLLSRATSRWNTVMEEAAKLTEGTDEKQKKAIRTYFRWRVVPSWLRTKGGLVILLSVGAGAAEGTSDPPMSFLKDVGLIALACVVATQLMRMIWKWYGESMRNVRGVSPPSPPCTFCPRSASYTYSVPGDGERLICSKHSELLQSRLKRIMRSRFVVKRLYPIKQDAQMAHFYDNSLEDAQQLMIMAQRTIFQFGG